MNNTWKAVIGVTVIFLFGCFFGAVFTSIVVHHRIVRAFEHPTATLLPAMEKRLTGNLGLDALQKQQVDAYFLQNFQQRKELQKQIQPQVQVLNQRTIQQITAILHPEQVERFQHNIEQFRNRFRSGR
jgi:hypothetical protein